MNELVKPLIDWLKGSRLGSELLVVIGALAALFSLTLYLMTTPQALNALRAPAFVAGTLVIIALWAASLCWRAHRLQPVLRRPGAAAIVTGAVAAAYFVVRPAPVPPLPKLSVVVVFDPTTDYVSRINPLAEQLRSPIFDPILDDRPIDLGPGDSLSEGDRGRIVEALARNDVHPSEPANGPIPILITAKSLANDQFTNLFSLTWSDLIVISTHDVGTAGSLREDIVAKYVATSIAMESIAAYAMSRDTTIVHDRSPGANRGCLSDFHRVRATFIDMAQHPVLCPEEAQGISSVLGPAALPALNSVLARIAQQ